MTNLQHRVTRAQFIGLTAGTVLAWISPLAADAPRDRRTSVMDANTVRNRFMTFRQRLYAEHDLRAVDEFLHPDFKSDSPMIPKPGIAAYKQFVRGLHEALPDLHALDQHIVVEQDQLMTMTRWQATHRGPFLGVQATGKTLQFSTADRYVLRDGLLYRHWDVVDRLQASLAIGLLKT